MNRKQHVLIPILFVCLAIEMSQAQVLPGVQMRLSPKGLAYVNSKASESIRSQLQNLQIKDQSGQTGRLSWSLSNIKTASVSGPDSQLALTPEVNGVTWTLSNFAISFQSDWHAKYKQGWIKISDGGSVTFSFSNVALALTCGFQQKDGRPSISTKSCNANIGSINVEFHGGAATVYNLLKGIVEDIIRDILEKRICEIVNKAVNTDAEEALSKMKIYWRFAQHFFLDYKLTVDPEITANYIQTKHKGEVYWEEDRQASSLPRNQIPASSDAGHMLYLWLTEFSANNFCQLAHNHGYLKYNLTKSKLRGENADYLNATCSSNSTRMCIGTLCREISKLYPDSWVELQMSSSAVPQVKITSEAVSAQVSANVDFIAHTPQGTTEYLLTLNVNSSANLKVTIEQESVMLKIDKDAYRFNISLVNSAIGKVNVVKLQRFINGILQFAVVPELNKIGASKGIKLPVTGDVKFQNTKLTLFNEVLMISTDLLYEKMLDLIG